MDENAQKVLDCLPSGGEKISGGAVREQIDLKRTDFDNAKKWLRDNGLVELGRGRGGTIKLIVGAEPPPEPKKLSQGEKLELAREEKASLTRAQKEREALREMTLEKAQKDYPDADDIEVQVWDVNSGKCYITVWKDKQGYVGEVYT